MKCTSKIGQFCYVNFTTIEKKKKKEIKTNMFSSLSKPFHIFLDLRVYLFISYFIPKVFKGLL